MDLNRTLGHAIFKFSSTSAIIPDIHLHDTLGAMNDGTIWNPHSEATLSLWIASSDVELDHD